MPAIDLTDEEHAAVTAAIRRAVQDDKFPRAPRLDPLRSGLAKLDPARGDRATAAAEDAAASPRQKAAILSRFRLANQRIGFLRFAACANSQGVWHGGKVSGYGER